MSFISHVPYFVREMFSFKNLERVPESELIMDGKENTLAYEISGKSENTMEVAYLYHSAKISETIKGCKRVIDLGCGPATILCDVATMNPETEFIGVDLSKNMLKIARKNVREKG